MHICVLCAMCFEPYVWTYCISVLTALKTEDIGSTQTIRLSSNSSCDSSMESASDPMSEEEEEEEREKVWQEV